MSMGGILKIINWSYTWPEEHGDYWSAGYFPILAQESTLLPSQPLLVLSLGLLSIPHLLAIASHLPNASCLALLFLLLEMFLLFSWLVFSSSFQTLLYATSHMKSVLTLQLPLFSLLPYHLIWMPITALITMCCDNPFLSPFSPFPARHRVNA